MLKDNRFASTDPRDGETNNDPTLFRIYNSRLYRWLSPNPMGGDIMNPQSLNRYAYVMNNPVNFIDPLGLQQEDNDNWCASNSPNYPECVYGSGNHAYNPYGGCYFEGVNVYCEPLYDLAQAGGAVECPPNTDCSTIRAVQGSGGTTILQQWIPGQWSDYSDPIRGTWGDQDYEARLRIWTPGHWQTLGRARDFNQSSLALVRAGQASLGRNGMNDVETLVVGLNTLARPIQNAIVSGLLFYTGAGTVAIGVGGTAYVCAQTGLLGCAATATFGGVPTVAGGLFLLQTGVRFTREVTIPSFAEVYGPLF